MALPVAQPRRAAKPELSQTEVARVAYALFLERGQAHGHDLEDWLRAEQIVRQRQRSNGR